MRASGQLLVRSVGEYSSLLVLLSEQLNRRESRYLVWTLLKGISQHIMLVLPLLVLAADQDKALHKPLA